MAIAGEPWYVIGPKVGMSESFTQRLVTLALRMAIARPFYMGEIPRFTSILDARKNPVLWNARIDALEALWRDPTGHQSPQALAPRSSP